MQNEFGGKKGRLSHAIRNDGPQQRTGGTEREQFGLAGKTDFDEM